MFVGLKLPYFYENKKKWNYVFKNRTASKIVKKFACETGNIEVEGIHNLDSLNLDNGAIITVNHFNPLDSYAPRKVVEDILNKKMYIVIEDTNLAMSGNIGFLMNYLDVIPITKSPNYLINKFKPELKDVLNKGNIVLIYPEEEMWFNYRKPRPCKRGAYQFASEFNVPIISCFVEIVDLGVLDNDEFNKVKYIVHILNCIYPDSSKSVRANSIDMANKDYEQKKEAYEKAYNKIVVNKDGVDDRRVNANVISLYYTLILSALGAGFVVWQFPITTESDDEGRVQVKNGLFKKRKHKKAGLFARKKGE